MHRWLLCTAFLCVLTIAGSVAAMITGGDGNSPVRDPGWPKGAAEVFNVESRVAYWVGPPLGGGQYTAECRGDTLAFNAALADFAQIDSPKKQLFLHDGVGASFWLNMNDEVEKRQAALIDWKFTIWIPASYAGQQEMPAELRDESSPHPIIHLYVGGSVNWENVRVPDGVELIDERLATHGFETADGTVLDGELTDLESNQPLTGSATLKRITPLKTGGYDYDDTKTVATANGKWTMKSIPEGRFRVILSAPGYTPRIAHHLRTRPGPLWVPIKSALSKPAKIEGTITGPDGKPLSGVRVRLGDFVMKSGGRYATNVTDFVLTSADGKFEFCDHPQGTTRVHVHKEGYTRPGLGLKVTSPVDNLELEMIPASSIEVRVDFGDLERPKGYIVEIEPEGGNVVGAWGGGANIDATNKYTFKHIPPGKYVLKGRPNPGSKKQETELHKIEIKGGEAETVVLKAKSGE